MNTHQHRNQHPVVKGDATRMQSMALRATFLAITYLKPSSFWCLILAIVISPLGKCRNRAM